MSKFSVRLPPEDDSLPVALQSRWKLDRSKTIRRATGKLQRPPIPFEGWFIALDFRMRVKGKSREYSS